jgi:hypothetical protein
MNNRFETPILLLIFNRPDTTKQVFNQVKKIKPKYLFVAADGPRTDKSDEDKRCLETRDIIKQINWDCELKTLFREKNLGCRLAVSQGITWFFNNVGEGIILEDDCLPELSFFPYCEELLRIYRNEDKIFLVGGNNFQNGIKRGNGSFYFSNYAHIWGWASWRRAWKKYDLEMNDFQKTFTNGRLDHVFQCRAEKKFWGKIFSQVKQKKIDTWDYQWTYSIWKNKGLSITPNANLVINLGLVDNSTRNFLKDGFREKMILNSIDFPLIYPSIHLNSEADKYTFENRYAHSFRRIIRILKENGILPTLKYIFRRSFR